MEKADIEELRKLAKGKPWEGLAELAAAANPNEDLSLIIQYHLLIEECFNLILEKNLRYPEILEVDRLGFFRKVQLVCALGYIPKDLYEPLSQLNKIRNKFAHNSGRKLDQADVESVWATMPRKNMSITDETIRESTPRANIVVLGCLLAPIYGTMQSLKDGGPSKRLATLLSIPINPKS